MNTVLSIQLDSESLLVAFATTCHFGRAAQHARERLRAPIIDRGKLSWNPTTEASRCSSGEAHHLKP